jgi:hypothetical protein
MGGLKERKAKDEHALDPTSVLRKAVLRMLPKTNLQKVRYDHLDKIMKPTITVLPILHCHEKRCGTSITVGES